MLVVQIRLTADMVNKLDELIIKGKYPNRSEAIRDATRNWSTEIMNDAKNRN